MDKWLSSLGFYPGSFSELCYPSKAGVEKRIREIFSVWSDAGFLERYYVGQS